MSNNLCHAIRLYGKPIFLARHLSSQLSSQHRTMTSTTQPGSAWYAAYPPSKTEARSISREEVLTMLNDAKNIAGRDFIFVDLRRADHEVRGSNL